jgi:hypothetical protein
MAAPGPKQFRMSELKQKLLRPAQTSVYMVDITTGGGFAKFVGQRGLNLGTDGELINISCCEASLPGSSLATHEVTNDYHGVTEKMAYRRIYDDSIDLTFYVDHQYKVIEYLNSWMNFVVGEGSTFNTEQYKDPTTFYRMNWPLDYRNDIYLTKFEKDFGTKGSMNATLKYQFISAFPTNLVSIPVSYESSDLLKVTVSFHYLRYVRTRVFSATNMGSVPQTPSDQAVFNQVYNNGTDSFNANPDYGAGSVVDPAQLFNNASPVSRGGFTDSQINTAISQELAVQASGQAPSGGFNIF